MYSDNHLFIAETSTTITKQEVGKHRINKSLCCAVYLFTNKGNSRFRKENVGKPPSLFRYLSKTKTWKTIVGNRTNSIETSTCLTNLYPKTWKQSRKLRKKLKQKQTTKLNQQHTNLFSLRGSNGRRSKPAFSRHLRTLAAGQADWGPLQKITRLL